MSSKLKPFVITTVADPKTYQKEATFYRAKSDFIAYKKCATKSGKGVVVTLLISKNTLFYSGTKGLISLYRKLRAEKATVLNTKKKSARSSWDCNFNYKKDEIVKPEYPFDKRKAECASGIHFFLTYEEAKRWPL